MAKVDGDRTKALLQEVFAGKNGMKMLLQEMIQQALEEQVRQHLGADRYERSEDRAGWRNGYKPRTLATRVGELELSVPQVRGCEPYDPGFWNRWQRSERALLVACAEMYFQGVSTGKVRQVLEAMCDGQISSMTVSRIAGELDEKLAAFRGRSLGGIDWPYLQIDARYEHVRVEGKIVSQAILVVIGVNALGRREVLDWRVGDSESEQTWGQMFRDLKDRGLTGLKLVVSDAHAGIRSALNRHFQGVAWQRCTVHFKRELGRRVSYKQRKELMNDVRAVLAGEDKAECLRRGQEMAGQWEKRNASVARMMREGLEDCLAVLGEPEHVRGKLASTNLPESVMRVLGRRTGVVTVFPNRASCDRLVGALLLEQHEKWLKEGKAYLNLARTSG